MKEQVKKASMDRSERSEGSMDSQLSKNASTIHDDLDFVNHPRHRMRRRDDSLVDSRVSTSGHATMEGRERNWYSMMTAQQSTTEVSWTSPRRFSMLDCPRPEQTQMVAVHANPELTSRSPRRKSVADSSMSDSRQNAGKQGGREESSGSTMRRSIVNSSNKSTQKSSGIESRATDSTTAVHMDIDPNHQSDDRVFGVPSASSQGLPRRTSMPIQQNSSRRVRTAENDGHAKVSSTVQRIAHDGHRQVRSTDRTARTEYDRPHRSMEGHGSALSNGRTETVEDRSARPAPNVGDIDKSRLHRIDVQSGQKQASTTAWAAQIEGKTRATNLSTHPP